MSATTTTILRRADAASVADAARALRHGALVAFPTETVYGLGADATNGVAVARIFEVKGRPRINPLIVHVRNYDDAERLVQFSPVARRLAEAFWPGALTLVLPRREDCEVSLLASAGLDTLAVRVPAHAVARLLLDAVKLPIAAPSANLSGRVSATIAEHVASELDQKIDLILDGGAAPLGLESTVIGFDGAAPVLLRAGAVARGTIEDIAGPLQAATATAIQSPGRLSSHYAPHAELRLNAKSVKKGEALLAFGSPVPDGASVVQNLSAAGDLHEAAANLFAMLRALDASATKTHRRHADPGTRSRRSDQRPARARRGADGDARMNDDVLARLKQAVGAKGFSEDPSEIAPHLEEWRSKYTGQTALLLKPATTDAGLGDPCDLPRDRHRDRAAGRQHRAGGRANSLSRRSAAVPPADEPHPRVWTRAA